MTAVALDHLRRFAIPGLVSFETGPGGLIRAVVTAGAGEAHVYLHGAHVTHFAPRGERPVLFTSARSLYAPDRAIRGGVPVIFPWFGARAGDASAPMHGFARTSEWEVVSVEEAAGSSAQLVLGLSASARTRAAWPPDFEARYRVAVGASLDLALDVRNASGQPFTFEEALHTYLAVADVTAVAITGLAGTTYVDKTDGMKRKQQGEAPLRITSETDRVYLDTRTACAVDDPRGGRRLLVEKAGSATTVVWNPWQEKARAMADFDPEEWRSMVCVETANAADNAVVLAPGERHELTASIRVA
jgi:D-hexose-6-phosphate mutarotase